MEKDSHLYCTSCGAAYPPRARFCSVCGHSLQSVEPIQSLPIEQPAASFVERNSSTYESVPQVSRLLKNRYRIIAQIGSGGYGKVYKAVDTGFANRQVAIKEMLQQGLNEQEIVEVTEAFKREALMLATMTHPNLPSIYDYFTENGSYYLVMSFIDGVTLGDYLVSKGGVLPTEKVLQIGIQLATVLSFLHTKKPAIIFRDLKPSNVMRTPDGQIYLIDFGIARHFKQGKVKDTLILGSPGYAAPEQYGRSQTSPQTDIYSLGVLLHQLLTGVDPSRAPFAQKPLKLLDYPQLANLIMCMLELDVKKRPLSMGNIKREMQRIISGRGHNHDRRVRVQDHVSPRVMHEPLLLPSASVVPLSLRPLPSASSYSQKLEGFLRQMARLMVPESPFPQSHPKQK